MSRHAPVVLSLSLALMATRAEAGLVAADNFSRDAIGSPLQGQGGGFGFADAWHPGGYKASISSNYTVTPGPIAYPGLQDAGNTVTTGMQSAISGLSRSLSTPLGTPGTTDYISFLVRPEGTVGQGAFGGFFGLYLNASTNGPGISNDLFIGKPGTSSLYDLEDRGGTNRSFSSQTAVAGEAVLLVVRVDFTAGLDKFTLHVNPTPGGLEPLSGTVKQDSDVGTVSSLTLYSTGAYSLGDLRIGTTFADVVPAVPEPSSSLLTILGGIGVLAASRRRARKPSAVA